MYLKFRKLCNEDNHRLWSVAGDFTKGRIFFMEVNNEYNHIFVTV